MSKIHGQMDYSAASDCVNVLFTSVHSECLIMQFILWGDFSLHYLNVSFIPDLAWTTHFQGWINSPNFTRGHLEGRALFQKIFLPENIVTSPRWFSLEQVDPLPGKIQVILDCSMERKWADGMEKDIIDCKVRGWGCSDREEDEWCMKGS